MITLIPHQPIDFSYNSPDTDEELSTYALHYNLSDNPMFQFKNTTGTMFLVTIQGAGETIYAETAVNDYVISGDYVTYTLDFTGLSAGCYSLSLYTITTGGPNLISNGTFESDLSGWTAADALLLDVDSFTYESAPAACDGEVVLLGSGGGGSLTYSDDGVSYQVSATFSPLCAGNYTVYVKDSNNLITELDFEIFETIDCSDYAGSEAFDLVDLNTTQLLDCEAFDFV